MVAGRRAKIRTAGSSITRKRRRSMDCGEFPFQAGSRKLVDDIAMQGRWTVSRRGVYYLTADQRLEFRDWTSRRLTTLRTSGLRLASHARRCS